MNDKARLGALLAVLVGAACSDGMPAVHRAALPAIEPSEPPEPSATVDAGAPSDAGSPEAKADAMTDAAPPPARRGAVFAISDTMRAGSTHRVGAYFVEARGGFTQVADRVIGPCVLKTLSADDDAPAEKDVAAGAIAMRVGSEETTLAPSARGTYATKAATGALWAGGEEVTLTLAGAAVPAMNARAVAPSTLTTLVDGDGATDGGANDLGSAVSIDRAAPFSIRWAGRSAGVVVAYFDLAEGDVARTLTCSFDANGGEGTVPAAAFAAFGAGEGTFALYTKVATPLSAGGWNVVWNMSSTLVTPRGDATQGRATYR